MQVLTVLYIFISNLILLICQDSNHNVWNDIEKLTQNLKILHVKYFDITDQDFQNIISRYKITESDVQSFQIFRNIFINRNKWKTIEQADKIFPLFKEYLILKNCKNALADLDIQIDNPSPLYMNEFISTFHLTDLSFNDQTEFANKLKNKYGPITDPQIERIWPKYQKYMEQILRQKAHDQMLSAIGDRYEIPVFELTDVFENFNEIFLISQGMKFPDQATFKSHVINLYTHFNLDKIPLIYIFYNDYLEFNKCNDAVKSVLTLVESSVKFTFDSFEQKIENFALECNIHVSFETENNFFEEIKIVNPFITPIQSKVIYSLHNQFSFILELKKIVNKLLEIYNQGGIQILKMKLEIEKFDNVLKLKANFMNYDDFKTILGLQYTFAENEVSVLYETYILHIKWQKVEQEGTKIYDKIKDQKNILIYELEDNFKNFIDLCNIKERETFASQNDFLSKIQTIHPEFDPTKSSDIYEKYIEFVDLEIRRNSAEAILKLLKGSEVPPISELAIKYTEFEKLYFKEIRPNFVLFKEKLSLDSVTESNIDLLYHFYLNYLSYKFKVEAISKVLAMISPIKMHEVVKELDLFMYSCNLDFSTAPEENVFSEYLNSQHLVYKNEEIKNLYKIYFEYMKYKKRVEKRLKIFEMILKNTLLSDMISVLKEFYELFELQNTDIYDSDKFMNYYSELDGSLNEESIKKIRLKIIEYVELLQRRIKKYDLLEFLRLYPKASSEKIEGKIEPFIQLYKLTYSSFSDSKSFHDHLKSYEDNIEINESGLLYEYYKTYVIAKNRQNTRKYFMKYISHKSEYTHSEIFPYVELLVSAYKLTEYSFENFNEFRKILENRDDMIKIHHITAMYKPVMNYLGFIRRRQKLEALSEFKSLRTEATIFELDRYVNDVFNSYLLDDQILSENKLFREFVQKLDNIITISELYSLQQTLINHRLLMIRINIKNALLTLIKNNYRNKIHKIENLMELYIGYNNLADIDIIDFNEYKIVAKENDWTINERELEIIHLALVPYVKHVERKTDRINIIGFIRSKPTYRFQEISPLIKQYISSHNLTYSELHDYDLFYAKNKALDETASTYDIKFIFNHVNKYISSEEFNIEEGLLEKRTVGYPGYVQNTIPQGINTFWYKIFKYMGMFPHQAHNVQSVEYLNKIQALIHSIFKYLCGIDYFIFSQVMGSTTESISQNPSVK